MVRICEATITGLTPYSQSRRHETPKLNDKEKPGAYEERTWREKATFDDEGNVAVPAMALKMCVDESIKRLGIQIPGKKSSTYTKYFLAGQICDTDMQIGVNKDELKPKGIWANADGVRGSGKRVKRIFPEADKWGGIARFTILDDVIDKNVFERAVKEAGLLIGIGRFRPEKGGFYGRFRIEGFKWSEMKI